MEGEGKFNKEFFYFWPKNEETLFPLAFKPLFLWHSTASTHSVSLNLLSLQLTSEF